MSSGGIPLDEFEVKLVLLWLFSELEADESGVLRGERLRIEAKVSLLLSILMFCDDLDCWIVKDDE